MKRTYLILIILILTYSCSLGPLPDATEGEENYIMLLNNSGNPSSIAAKINKLPKLSLPKKTDSRAVEAAEAEPGYIKDLIIPQQDGSRFADSSRSYSYEPATKVDVNTEEADFYVFDSYGYSYKITAEKKYGNEDSKCIIFAEKDAYPTKTETYVSDDSYNQAGIIFDTEIYPVVTKYFGTPVDVDENGKVIILYFAMLYNSSFYIKETRVCGFFYKGDLYEQTFHGNKAEIFYINLNCAHPLNDLQLRTLAHEFQHMINFSERVLKNNKPEMDLWIDEGLAESAETIYSKEPNYSRISRMSKSSLIANGHPLVIFKNYLEDYALSYTFIQYLRIQAGQSITNPEIYSDIVTSRYGDYRSLVEIMSKVDPINFNSFEKILTGYYTANKFNGDGIYGYRNEKEYFDFTSVEATYIPENLQAGGCIWIPVTKEDMDEYIIPPIIDPKLTIKKIPKDTY
jgi:hypothetical protein